MSLASHAPFHAVFTIQTDTKYLQLLRSFVAAAGILLGEKHFPRSAQRAVTFSLIEAVDNAIFHAHRRRRDLPIRIALLIQYRRAVVEIVDNGPGVPKRLLMARPEESYPDFFATHGRGLLMIKGLAQGIKSIRSEKKHRLQLTYRW